MRVTRIIIYLVGATATIPMLGCGGEETAHVREDLRLKTVEVKIESVKPQEVATLVNAVGTVRSEVTTKLSSQIPYLMATSRIAHYLKAICRDKIGSFMSREDCEKFLNRWISNLVLGHDDATQVAKAKKPLREARIDVIENKAKPGCYQAIAYLRPHFQLEELGVSLRLVADLPPPAK